MADINDGVAVQPKHEAEHSALSQYIQNGPPEAPKTAETSAPKSDSSSLNGFPTVDTSEWKSAGADTNPPSAPEAQKAPGAPENPYQTPAADGNHNHALDHLNQMAESEGPALSDSQEAILDNADAGVGTDLWKQSKHADVTQDGKLGAAASVSVLLQQAGYTHIDNASIRGLEQDMKNSGFEQKPVDERQPGDVIIGDRGNGGQRVYVQAENGQVYGMRADGKWAQFDMPKDLKNARVLRAPGTCPE